MTIFEVNAQFGNEGLIHNPKVNSVVFENREMTWIEWGKLCQTMKSETEVKIHYASFDRQLYIYKVEKP